MVSYDISRVFTFFPNLFQALPMTLWILLLTTVFGSIFGVLLAWAQLSKEKS